MKRMNVESSLISRIGYDIDNQTLEIEFRKNGQIKQFTNVDRNLYEYLEASTSKGMFYLRYIEGHYPEK